MNIYRKSDIPDDLQMYFVPAELGLEPTPEEYVAKMVEVFREVRRVLRDDGAVWLNLGDSYNGSGGAGGDYSEGGLKEGQPKYPGRKIGTLKPKDLIGIPWRVAFALQADGWWLRQDIIWHKPNPMPESVRDRCTKAHEYIFLLTKSARYFYDAEAVKEPAAESTKNRVGYKVGGGHGDKTRNDGDVGERLTFEQFATNGRNKRSVWTVTTKPFKGAHFAVFPPDLIEPCILAGTSAKGRCPECGSPWERVVEKGERYQSATGRYGTAKGRTTAGTFGSTSCLVDGKVTSYTTTGWKPACDCGANPVPCTVLDPFTGSGTTGVVAAKHGRDFIGIELNPEYAEMARRRIAEETRQGKLPI